MKLQRKIYTTRGERERDLAIGVFVFLALNILLVGIAFGLGALSVTDYGTAPLVGQAVNPLLSLLPVTLNGGLIVFFAFWRHWIALGMLFTFGVLLALGSVCLACLWLVSCGTLFGQ